MSLAPVAASEHAMTSGSRRETLEQRAGADINSDAARGDSSGGTAAVTEALLHIDGTLLGQWIEQHLDRKSKQPYAGTTSVDPRITPVWAGPALGV